MADSRQQDCDTCSPRKTAAEDPRLPENPTIIVNDTDSCDTSKEVLARRKQGNASGPSSFSPSSPCEPENGTQQHNLHQPPSNRSSIDSGVGGLSRTNSSGSVKKTSVEGLLDKPGCDFFEPINEVSSLTKQPPDEDSCSILPESLNNILKLEHARISSTTPEFDSMPEHTEILGRSRDVQQDEKGDLPTGELRGSRQDTNTENITSTTEEDEPSWITRKERKSIPHEAIENLVKAVQVICNETQHQPPHVVTQKPTNFSTTSEHVTENDGPFHIYPVRRHSTAGPSIPLTQHSKQTERTRKRSVQPFFHHLVSRDDENYKRRKKSACIMCERNHITETAESATSVFIRKAVTPLDCQKGRRYSEVLKTYKPSEIPFTEVRVLKMEKLRQNERVGHRQESTQSLTQLLCQSQTHAITDMQLQEILERNMPTFLQCTNWSGIFSHLVAKRLLDNDCREILLCPLRTNTDKGNYFYGRVLPAMGRESNAYIKFYQCLEETKDEHPGHNTLFHDLCNGLRSYYYNKYCLATRDHQN